jgi:hypothetical protein
LAVVCGALYGFSSIGKVLKTQQSCGNFSHSSDSQHSPRPPARCGSTGSRRAAYFAQASSPNATGRVECSSSPVARGLYDKKCLRDIALRPGRSVS